MFNLLAVNVGFQQNVRFTYKISKKNALPLIKSKKYYGSMINHLPFPTINKAISFIKERFWSLAR